MVDDYDGADRRREAEGWHLDKRIPIATLVAILTLAVGGIIVTTSSGKRLNGDEVSQGRMSHAIMGMQAVGAPSIVWVLADNISATVTVGELTEALVLSGQEQGRVWIIE